MKYNWIVIGGSAGAFEALKVALSVLPSDFPLPILIVRHQSAESVAAVDELLGAYFNLNTKYAESGEMPQQGTIYLAPPDKHLLLDTDGSIVLSTSEKVNYSRPSIDLFFESVAKVPNGVAIAVILTGANQDGAAGLKEIVVSGGHAIIQHPDSAVSKAMPLAALQLVPAAKLVWLDQIGSYLWDVAGKA